MCMQSDAQLLWLCNFVPCLCRVCEAQHPYGTTALAVLQDAVLAANEESLCGSHGGRVVHRCTTMAAWGLQQIWSVCEAMWRCNLQVHSRWLLQTGQGLFNASDLTW